MSRVARVPEDRVRDYLVPLGFVPPEDGQDTWMWRSSDGSVAITVATSGLGRIGYPTGVTIGRRTTCNLKDEENLVVLACMCQLLDQGYAPDALTVEKSFPLGHGSGWLDILVSQSDQTFMMIECKTAGNAFEQSLQKLTTRRNSQLLSYFIQDRDARFLVLYAAQPVDGHIVDYYQVVATASLAGGNLSAVFDSWDKRTFTGGLFEGSPYSLGEVPISVADLEDLTQPDGSRLFNSINEILRRHAVSDKPNAFNKIFNLFICKVQDEEKVDPSATTEFQWLNSEEREDVLDRLSDLYRRGLSAYLDIQTADLETSQIESILTGVSAVKTSQLVDLFKSVRQMKNTDFAFIEVYDEETFKRNADIVRDVVRLLQRKRLRYSEKHGFMGIFFEKLLNTSVKQESGQFFTPTPIAQFMCDSLPIESIVSAKLAAGDEMFLPYAIDYAAGSGHFLTEVMDRVDRVLQGLAAADLTTRSQQMRAEAWRSGLAWAGEFVYGIELDYRLAKTSKVSCFLNGDGDANVVHGSGLGHFHLDAAFQRVGKKLWRSTDTPDRDLGNFDVVVANPPYSVSEFRREVLFGEQSFELFDEISDTSKAIEVLFVERTKHLLRTDGVAAIVLPTAILSNGGVERSARKLLTRYFDLIAVVSLGPKTFVATGTSVSIVFLRRKADDWVGAVDEAVDSFLAGADDYPLGEMETPFATYVGEVHGGTVEAYLNSLGRPHTAEASIFEDYIWEFETNIRGNNRSIRDLDGSISQSFVDYVEYRERDRMTAFFHSYGKRTLLVNAPTGEAEKQFLGYELSSRRRHEGISFTSGTAKIETPLFDPDNKQNEKKINHLIRSAFDSSYLEVPTELAEYCSWATGGELLPLDRADFDYSVATHPVSIGAEYAVDTVRLGSLSTLDIGGTPSRRLPQYFRGENLWLSVGEMNGQLVTATKEMITDEAVRRSNAKLVPEGTLMMSFKLSLGRWAIAGKDLYTNEAIAALAVKESPAPDAMWIDTKYLTMLLDLFATEVFKLSSGGAKKFGRSVNRAFLSRIPIPVMSAEDRSALVAVYEDADLTTAEKKEQIGVKLWSAG